MSAVDFSEWNDLPWWNKKGYKTEKEAWDNANLSAMCILTQEQLVAQEERCREINRKHRGKSL